MGYAEPVEVTGAGEGSALTTRWRAAWTPSVAARLDLVGVRGVTAAQAADGTLRENHRRAAEAGRVTSARVVALLGAAARCALTDLLHDGLTEAERVLPGAAALPELLAALDLLDSVRRRHLPGTTETVRIRAARLAGLLLDAAVRLLPGLAGSDEPGTPSRSSPSPSAAPRTGSACGWTASCTRSPAVAPRSSRAPPRPPGYCWTSTARTCSGRGSPAGWTRRPGPTDGDGWSAGSPGCWSRPVS